MGRTPAAPSIKDLPTALATADHIVVAVPLTAATHHLFSDAQFAAMQPHACLINVARGEVVDTAALVRALDYSSISGAGLDVADPEPLPDGHPLWGA